MEMPCRCCVGIQILLDLGAFGVGDFSMRKIFSVHCLALFWQGLHFVLVRHHANGEQKERFYGNQQALLSSQLLLDLVSQPVYT